MDIKKMPKDELELLSNKDITFYLLEQSKKSINTKDLIVKTDKKRANYYNFYTNAKWADSRTYDLCVDSSKLGINGTVDMLADYVAMRIKAISNPVEGI